MMYLLFSWSTYYPAGGWQDFIGVYASLEAARSEAKGDRYQIVKMVNDHKGPSFEVVEYGSVNPFEIFPQAQWGW